MIADTAQTFAVILIVASALGYLGLFLRKTIKRSGACRRWCTPALFPPRDNRHPPPEGTAGPAFIPRDVLADRARRIARNPAPSDDQEPA